MAKDSSPFHQTELQPIENIYTKEGSILGIQLPSGEIYINFNSSTNYSYLANIAKLLRGEVVQVHGTWTFLPHRQTVLPSLEEETEENNVR